MYATVMLHSQKAFHIPLFWALAFTFFLPLFDAPWFGYWGNIGPTEHSRLLNFSTLNVINLCDYYYYYLVLNHCNTKLHQSRLGAAPIYGEKRDYIEVSLTTSAGSPLELTTSLAMSLEHIYNPIWISSVLIYVRFFSKVSRHWAHQILIFWECFQADLRRTWQMMGNSAFSFIQEEPGDNPITWPSKNDTALFGGC